jgi:hypothetical protein
MQRWIVSQKSNDVRGMIVIQQKGGLLGRPGIRDHFDTRPSHGPFRATFNFFECFQNRYPIPARGAHAGRVCSPEVWRCRGCENDHAVSES